MKLEPPRVHAAVIIQVVPAAIDLLPSGAHAARLAEQIPRSAALDPAGLHGAAVESHVVPGTFVLLPALEHAS